MTDKKLGFVGLGRMGGPMSERLINAGYELTVYDPSEAALNAVVAHGGRKAGSPREVADVAPIVLTSLPTGRACWGGCYRNHAGSFDHRPQYGKTRCRGFVEARCTVGRLSGQWRRDGGRERNIGGDGIVPSAGLCAH